MLKTHSILTILTTTNENKMLGLNNSGFIPPILGPAELVVFIPTNSLEDPPFECPMSSILGAERIGSINEKLVDVHNEVETSTDIPPTPVELADASGRIIILVDISEGKLTIPSA